MSAEEKGAERKRGKKCYDYSCRDCFFSPRAKKVSRFSARRNRCLPAARRSDSAEPVYFRVTLRFQFYRSGLARAPILTVYRIHFEFLGNLTVRYGVRMVSLRAGTRDSRETVLLFVMGVGNVSKFKRTRI